MKKYFIFLMVLFLTGCSSLNTTPLFEGKEELKIVVASDLHYYAKELFEDCSWFSEALLQEDGQMIDKTHLIVDYFVTEVIQEKPDLVILTGDLTYNGEKMNHEQLAQYLQKLEDNGIEVAIIDGNHDVNNVIARKYTDEGSQEVESVTEKEFKKIYNNFGYNQASNLDKYSLSYRLPLNETYDLLMIDTCSTDGYSTASEISEETMEWIETQLASIQSSNKKAIVGMHHNVTIHCDAIYNGYVLNNHHEMEKLLKTYDVPVVFSGHIHVQHMEEMDGLYEIVSSALSVSPVQYGVATINDTLIDYHTQEIISIENDQEFFWTTSYNSFIHSLSELFDEQTAHKIASYVAQINVDYFSGKMGGKVQDYKNDKCYQLILSKPESLDFLVNYINAMLVDDVDQTQLQIKIK